MYNEDAVGSGKGEAKCACVDKVLGESAYFAPGVGCDAALVDTTGKSLECKYDLGADGRDETGEANDSMGHRASGRARVD